jgi:hypothetical protein
MPQPCLTYLHPVSAAAATGVKWQGSAFRQHSHAATSPRPSSGLQRWPSNNSNGAAAAAATQPEQQHKAVRSSSGCEGASSVVELSRYGSGSKENGDSADSLAQLRAHHSGLMRLGLLMAVRGLWCHHRLKRACMTEHYTMLSAFYRCCHPPN